MNNVVTNYDKIIQSANGYSNCYLLGLQSIRPRSWVVPTQRNCRSCSFMLCAYYIALLHFAVFTPR